ncbi:YibE/F-like protein [Corynebacterium sp. CMW7794]|uniref:YibE/F family protein n=1 Tax=Corynebacterium sp. CMW7794 TaxID=1603887 RepID=UPI000798961B|nr:YibE/F family protein [Corynebacterium sp. CMW7794]KXI17041.1 YibE/F-like protein [Corynebacterium sp. CMW7794]
MSRHSAPVTGRNPWRVGLAGALLFAFLLTAIGLAWQWPSGTPIFSPEFTRTYALNQPQITARVTTVDHHLCASPLTGTAFDEPPLRPAFEEDTSCTRALLDLTSGTNEGKQTQLVFHGVAGDPTLEVDQEVLLAEATNPDGSLTYSFADYKRGGELWIWAAIVAIIIVGFGAWQGLRALLGLAYSLAVVFLFLLPALLQGHNPIVVTLLACSIIVLIAVPMVHGVNWKAAAAMGGSLLALGVTALLAWAMIDTTHLQGLSSEDNLKLVLYLPGVSVIGVLMAGFIIGALGSLNDAAIAQASTVTELAAAEPEARAGSLFVSAMKVGRDHIASMVYTLVLTYTGAALPLLILITAAKRPAGQILVSDLVSTELLRSGIGAAALTIAVPLATIIAALTVPERRALQVVSESAPR